MKKHLSILRVIQGRKCRQMLPLLFLGALFALTVAGCGGRSKGSSPNIRTLDSLLNHSEEFQLQRLTNIAELKQKRLRAASPSDQYHFDRLLFENYYTLNADSALKYVDACIAVAERDDNREWLTESLINKASLLAATGLMNTALEIMKSINPATLSREQLVEYYGQMVYLYSHLGNYTGGSSNEYYVTERLYKDSVMSVIPEDHPEYLWYKSWDILGTNRNPDSIIQALKENLAASSLTDRQDAKNAYALARLYEQKGDMKSYEDYMALSAIVDVKIANAEIASLEDLARLFYKDGSGDIDRAYSYINYSFNKALEYPNRSRALGIALTLEKINTDYQERIIRQQHRTTVFLVLMCVMAGILLLAIIAIIIQNKKVNRQRKEVNEANDMLNQKVEELSAAEEKLSGLNNLLQNLNNDLRIKNDQLHESNFVKEEYIGYVFNLCSSYLAKISDLKRNIYIKIVKKQYKSIENETSDLDMKEELKEFYHSFDTIFLNIYPNFVSDFNSLLKSDKQIVVKEGELLNMELRIYALVRLGIQDSVKIADFLHCAPQTVYNYRLRARSRSIYPKNDFIEMVKSLGSFDSERK